MNISVADNVGRNGTGSIYCQKCGQSDIELPIIVFDERWPYCGSCLAEGVGHNTPYEEGRLARHKGLDIHHNAYDSTYRRADYEQWRRGWFSETNDAAWNACKFICDCCHHPLTLTTYKPTNDYGGMVCKDGCTEENKACGFRQTWLHEKCGCK